jgi:prepilin-type N-terminal cleavage/methylation domain-containing protein
MKNTISSRSGYTLIEVLIVIAIIAIIVGLTLSAIQKARTSSLNLQNKNNIKQIMLAIHQVANEKDGQIVDLSKSNMKGLKFAYSNSSLFYRIVPYVQGTIKPGPNLTSDQWIELFSPEVKIYRNPADPSWDHDATLASVRGKCSYALNMFALDGSIDLSSTLHDGSSNTIAIGDKYAARCSSMSNISQTINIYTHLFDPMMGEVFGDRRATFADAGWQDVLPIKDAATMSTRPSVAGKTFQVKPLPKDVDPSILQTPFTALTVGMFDGSVRTISPSIRENIYWALITPAGGEIANFD